MRLPVAAPKGRWGIAFDYAEIVVGSLLVAAGTNLFFVPNNVVSGGVTGISIIAHHYLGTPVGLVVLALNLPLLWLGWRFAGGIRFFVRTVVSVLVLSAGIDLTAPFLVPPTHDRLLVICYGGLLDGLGMGLVFRGRGTTGGTDILARLAHRHLGIGIGQALLVMNVAIFGGAAFVFGAEAVMVALALAFVSARVLDVVQSGFSAARSALIISEDCEAVRDAILNKLGRGVTVLQGQGGYTGEKRPVLYVVVSPHEVGRLKRLVAQVDRSAFVAITPAQEVLGEGFAPHSGEEAL
ncbi:MAG TPA: YitT family protein [Thermoanaerobaculaceae bacterium]|nr:YitT family protein [Thermoanaerobaculaceae bacterium]